MTKDIFTNKVEASGIIALDLIDFKSSLDIIEFDIKNLLFMEMIVKEKEFRAFITETDFTVYKEKAVAITCSVDTIIPPWVFMILANKFSENAIYFDFNNADTVAFDLWKNNLASADLSSFKDRKVVVRARPDIPHALYMIATQKLKHYAKAIMYGEIGMPKVIWKR